MKNFKFVLSVAHHRTGAIIGKSVGMIEAENIEEATTKVYEDFMSDNKALELIEEINSSEKGFIYTVYKSSF